MAMLPDTNTGELGSTLVNDLQPNATYKMLVEDEQVAGKISTDLSAVRQAVYKILNTERYKHIIYSWNYGCELKELIGKPVPYCLSEIPRRIKEALVWDDRITDVQDFDLTYNKLGSVLAKFTVITIYGDIEMELEVKI